MTMKKNPKTVVAEAVTDTANHNVEYVLPAVQKALPGWKEVRDCIDGQDAIRNGGTSYLPMPNPADRSPENLAHYDNYVKRGLFVNFVDRTLNGLVGTAFSKPPVATLPAVLEVMHENVDGGSVSMDQQARQVLTDVLSVGRCGLLADYPTTGGPVTRDKITSGEVRPVIQYYFAEDITNWRYSTHNSLRLLTKVVLREGYEIEVDEFESRSVPQYRVLRLDMSTGRPIATTQVYRPPSEGARPQPIGEAVPILDHSGKPFDRIPFEFVGSRNNDGGIDEAPMRTLASINIAHYRNSCDFEEMVFVLGQPTTVISGLSQAWVDDVLKGEVVMGSTRALMLPEGATAEYLQVNESQLALKAMEHKEKLAISIGAKLVNEGAVQRTAKEATMDDASEQSTLLSAVLNVNSAYKRLLSYCAKFAGAPVTDDMGYVLNTDFEILQLDQNALTARVKLWTDGAISFTEMRSILRRAGVATQDDEEAKEEIKEEALENAAAMGLGNPADPNLDDEEGDDSKRPGSGDEV